MNMSRNVTRSSDQQSIIDFDHRLVEFTVVASYTYVLLAIIGVLLNTYVLLRLITLACNDSHRFRSGTGLPLAAMCSADLLTLMSIIINVLLSEFMPMDLLHETVQSLYCKISIFVIHSMTGFSTWCWLFVSALRYMAVYHPLWHISHQQIGRRLLLIILLFSLIINCWLLLAVIAKPQTCEESPLLSTFILNRLMHANELGWSYILPVCITFVLDIQVLLTHPPGLAGKLRKQQRQELRRKLNCDTKIQLSPIFTERSTTTSISDTIENNSNVDGVSKKSSSIRRIQKIYRYFIDKRHHTIIRYPSSLSLGSSSINGRRSTSQDNQYYSAHSSVYHKQSNNISKARTAVWRWLTITTLDLLLNAPENLIRFIAIVHNPMVESTESRQLYHMLAVIARLLYFSQFCFNAAYLFAVVYRPGGARRRRAPQSIIAFESSSHQCRRSVNTINYRGELRGSNPMLLSSTYESHTMRNLT